MTEPRTTPDNPAASVDGADNHVCRPGATTYYCPTAGEVESDCHGGFDVCCGKPELHVPVGLREQYAAAINAKIDGTAGCANGHRLADAVLAVRDRETEWLRADLAHVHLRACRTAELLRHAEARVAELEAAIAHARALPQAPQVQVQIYGIAGQEDYNRGWSSAISAVHAALQAQQPTCACGEPDTPAAHRTDGPCYVTEQPATAEADHA